MSQGTQAIDSILNLQEAMGNLDGDVELLQEVMEIFLEIAPEQIDELEGLIKAGDIPAVDTLAHGLKGSASNFCASKFVATAYTLEHLAKDGSLDGGQELLQQLRADFAELSEVQADVKWDDIAQQWSS